MNYTWQVLHEAKLCSLCTAWITPVIQSVKTPAIACRATQNRVVDSDWWKWLIHGPFVWPNEHVGFVVFISYTLLLLYCFIALLFLSFTWDTVHERYLLSLKLSGVKLLGCTTWTCDSLYCEIIFFIPLVLDTIPLNKTFSQPFNINPRRTITCFEFWDNIKRQDNGKVEC